MKRLLWAIISVLVLTFTSYADTWTDPETGIMWTYELSESGVTICKYEWTYWWDDDIDRYDYLPVTAVSPRPKGLLSIPPTFNGLSVVAIGVKAFDGCNELTSLIIPNDEY